LGCIPVKTAAQATNPLLDKLLGFAREQGHDQKLAAVVTERLGLTKHGKTMIVRQVDVGNDDLDLAFNVLPKMPGVYIS